MQVSRKMPREAYGKAGTWIRSITKKIRCHPKKGGILSVGGVKMYRLLKPNGGLLKNQARERPSERQSESYRIILIHIIRRKLRSIYQSCLSTCDGCSFNNGLSHLSGIARSAPENNSYFTHINTTFLFMTEKQIYPGGRLATANP